MKGLRTLGDLADPHWDLAAERLLLLHHLHLGRALRAVWGLGFGVLGFELRAWGLRVRGLGFRV